MPSTPSIAAITRAAAAPSPRWSSIIAPAQTAPTGFAIDRPAMSGAEPCTGSKSPGPVPSGETFALAASPIPPWMAAPMSVMMSPKRLDATMTSNRCGCVTMGAGGVDQDPVELDVGEVGVHHIDDLVPHDEMVRARVRLGDARELAAPRPRERERVADDALDADAREDVHLQADLVAHADVHAPARTGVLALGVLAHADHVDVGRGPACERRATPGRSRIGRMFR